MNKALRMKHMQVWSLLALLLPAGIVGAWLSIKQPVNDRLLQPGHQRELSRVWLIRQGKGYRVELKSSEDNLNWQLVWTNRSTLASPALLAYTGGISGFSGAILLGRIDGRGTYHFALPGRTGDSSVNRIYKILLYDIIHHEVVDSLFLKIPFGKQLWE